MRKIVKKEKKKKGKTFSCNFCKLFMASCFSYRIASSRIFFATADILLQIFLQPSLVLLVAQFVKISRRELSIRIFYRASSSRNQDSRLLNLCCNKRKKAGKILKLWDCFRQKCEILFSLIFSFSTGNSHAGSNLCPMGHVEVSLTQTWLRPRPLPKDPRLIEWPQGRLKSLSAEFLDTLFNIMRLVVPLVKGKKFPLSVNF